MAMGRIVHFEIEVEDPDRASRFYQAVFGWKIEKWEGPMEYWLITTGAEGEAGIDGGMERREGDRSKTTNTVDVKSVDDTVRLVVANGGKVVNPKHPIPGVGYLAYCEDTEGIVFGVMQTDRSAKMG
jgi:predicted enzyme related to lactoylglutathione lyase